MKGFTKTVEDFNCAHCGAVVRGNGYTNHCPQCLWSRHVDNNPGDRAATCGGMMEPITVETDGDRFIITHKCQICGKEKRQRTTDDDNIDVYHKKNLLFMANKNPPFGGFSILFRPGLRMPDR